LRQYEIIGRHYPTKKVHQPKVFKMRLFAPNAVVARSRFNYYLTRLNKVKKSHCQVLKVEQVCGTFLQVLAWLRSSLRRFLSIFRLLKRNP
jgi:hypothetical protein